MKAGRSNGHWITELGASQFGRINAAAMRDTPFHNFGNGGRISADGHGAWHVLAAVKKPEKYNGAWDMIPDQADDSR
jgi:hypothetical protein